MRMTWLDWVARILVIIGGLVWGIIGLFRLNVVSSIFGANSAFSMIIYDLVGLAALWEVIRLFTHETVATKK